MASLGYWIGAPFRGRGYATEAARAMLAVGFDMLDLQRIDAHYLAGNDASGRVMENIGMKREGVLRQHIVKWDVPHDVILYGILASEYRAR